MNAAYAVLVRGDDALTSSTKSRFVRAQALCSEAAAVDPAVTAQMIRSAFATASVVLDASATPSRAAYVRAFVDQRTSSISTSNAVTERTPALASAAPKMPPTSPYPTSAMASESIAGDAVGDVSIVPQCPSLRVTAMLARMSASRSANWQS